MSLRTSAKDFSAFKKYCGYYADLLGLSDWEVFYEHIEDPNGCGARALVSASVSDRICVMVLNKTWDSDVTDVKLKRSARHEMLHLLLWSVLEAYRDHSLPKDYTIGEEHAVIKRLERVIK